MNKSQEEIETLNYSKMKKEEITLNIKNIFKIYKNSKGKFYGNVDDVEKKINHLISKENDNNKERCYRDDLLIDWNERAEDISLKGLPDKYSENDLDKFALYFYKELYYEISLDHNRPENSTARGYNVYDEFHLKNDKNLILSHVSRMCEINQTQVYYKNANVLDRTNFKYEADQIVKDKISDIIEFLFDTEFLKKDDEDAYVIINKITKLLIVFDFDTLFKDFIKKVKKFGEIDTKNLINIVFNFWSLKKEEQKKWVKILTSTFPKIEFVKAIDTKSNLKDNFAHHIPYEERVYKKVLYPRLIKVIPDISFLDYFDGKWVENNYDEEMRKYDDLIKKLVKYTKQFNFMIIENDSILEGGEYHYTFICKKNFGNHKYSCIKLDLTQEKVSVSNHKINSSDMPNQYKSASYSLDKINLYNTFKFFSKERDIEEFEESFEVLDEKEKIKKQIDKLQKELKKL